MVFGQALLHTNPTAPYVLAMVAMRVASMGHLTQPLKPPWWIDPLNRTIVGFSTQISLDVDDV